jgi:hypothetical protein
MPFKQAVNTSASVWRNGQADTVQQDGYEALLRLLVHFFADKATLSVSYSGTGNGKIDFLDGGVGAPTETWTIAFTSATAFTVTGSVSGAQAGGTTGTNYTTTGNPLTSLLSFRIDVGGTAFIATDTFTVTATANTIAAADVWVLDVWNPFDLYSTGVGDALWWHGEGDGTQAIYAGIRLTETPASQIWNWVHRCATGFSAAQDWETQPGVSPEYFTAFIDSDMLYWIAGGRRFYCVSAKVSTTYHAMYQGLFLPFASPEEYPYPICNLGEKDDEEAWNSAASDFNSFLFPSNSGAVRDVQGTWLVATDSTSSSNIQIWPAAVAGYTVEGVWDNHENFDVGDHQLFPAVLVQGPTTAGQPLTINTFGVLDGVRRVTGFGNSAETILTISTVDHVVFQNINLSTRENFWTLEMS